MILEGSADVPVIRISWSLLALLLFAAFSPGGAVGLARADSPVLAPAPFKVPPEGTRLVYENLETGDRESGIVGKSDGLIVTWTWQGSPGKSIGHFCSDCSLAETGPEGGPLARLYPLQRGRGIRFKRTRGKSVWRDEIMVIGTERLETPAGTFDCYVVRRRSTTPDESWRGEQRSWYAPKLGWVVKFEGFDTAGRVQRWQLVDYD